MAEGVQTRTPTLLQASELAHTLVLRTAPNGIRYTSFGDTNLDDADLTRIVQAVPAAIAPALTDRVFYFVPLALAEAPAENHPEHADPLRPRASEPTLIASVFTSELSDEAICHRNVRVPATLLEPAHEGVFISARLLQDQFALAFEFFINVGHAFATAAGIPESFAALVWEQALADVRGETSQDAFEARTEALAGRTPTASPSRAFGERRNADSSRNPDSNRHPGKARTEPAFNEKARLEFVESAFADALAIYQLSLAVDFDYSELREREYPLLAPASLAQRLRLIAQLFPPNSGYEFSIRYRRR